MPKHKMENFDKSVMKTEVHDKEKFVVSVHRDEERFKTLNKDTLLCKNADIIEIFAINTHLDSNKTFLAFRTIDPEYRSGGTTTCPPGNWHTNACMKYMTRLFPELTPFLEKEYILD